MIVAAPKIVGTNAIADIYRVSEYWVRRQVRNEDPRFLTGYIGKIGQRHCWNLHEALTGLYNPDELIPIGNVCAAPDCTASAGSIGLCAVHLQWLCGVFRTIEQRLTGQA